jgi:hypothetical protein
LPGCFSDEQEINSNNKMARERVLFMKYNP